MVPNSRVESVVRRLFQTDASALALPLNDKMYLLRQGDRQVVGKDPIKPDLFAAVVIELSPTMSFEELVRTAKRISVNPAGVGATTVSFAIERGIPTITFRRSVATAQPTDMEMLASADGGQGSDDSEENTPPPDAPEPQPRAASRMTPAPTAPLPVAAPPAAAAKPLPTAGVFASKTRDPGVGKRPIDAILMKQLELKASDTHLSSGTSPVMRVHGEMKQQSSFGKLESEQVEELLAPVVPERNREEFGRRSDTDFAYELPGNGRFRVNVFRDRKGIGAVFRQIPTKILSAEELGLPDSILRFGDLTKGLVLVTGPTGSGKSTTLAAIIDYINNNRTDHIITIEDPIEFVHPNKKCLVNQREVGVHTDSFKQALRAALREDPDIVLVGEMRDLETVAIAIETAETGHLVFGTLHTTTAVSTVDRIIDQFPADRQMQIRMMLSTSLKGVVAQTLCKKQGGGRIAALEILLVNSAVSNLIREGKNFQIPSIMQTSRNIGMVGLNDALLELVKARKIEAKEAYVKSVDKVNLVSAFKQANIPLPEEAQT